MYMQRAVTCLEDYSEYLPTMLSVMATQKEEEVFGRHQIFLDAQNRRSNQIEIPRLSLAREFLFQLWDSSKQCDTLVSERR
jgi:hypothetical protein